jgi:hypothetical protein
MLPRCRDTSCLVDMVRSLVHASAQVSRYSTPFYRHQGCLYRFDTHAQRYRESRTMQGKNAIGGWGREDVQQATAGFSSALRMFERPELPVVTFKLNQQVSVVIFTPCHSGSVFPTSTTELRSLERRPPVQLFFSRSREVRQKYDTVSDLFTPNFSVNCPGADLGFRTPWMFCPLHLKQTEFRRLHTL